MNTDQKRKKKCEYAILYFFFSDLCSSAFICGYKTVLVLLVLVISVAAQSPGDSITGKVVNESGEPIPNAVVLAFPEGRGHDLVSIGTDRDGTFRFSGLDGVSYYLSASMPSYINPLLDPRSGPSKQCKVGDSVTLVLIKGGVITGKVTNKAGNPVIGVVVNAKLIRNAGGPRLPGGPTASYASTDDRGVYRIYGLPAGSYHVLAGGTPDLSGNGVSPFSHDIPTYAPSATRETASEVTVRTGEEITDVDIIYRGERGRVISGVVTGPSFFSGISLSLTTVAADGSESNVSKIQSSGATEFAFPALADGDYFVTAQTHDSRGQMLMSESKSVRLRGADVDNVELTVMSLGSVSGRIVLDEARLAECKDKPAPPFAEISVSAWHRETESSKSQPKFIWQQGRPVNPDAQGKFLLKNLAPAEYFFAAQFPARGWYLRSITLGPPVFTKPRDTTRVWTTVKREQLSGITMTLAQGAAALQGVVSQQGAESSVVYLIPAEPENAKDLLRFYGAQTSKDGKFAIFNIAAGRYWILVHRVEDGLLNRLRLPDEAEFRAGLRREAEAGKSEIELKPCQNVMEFQVKPKTLEQD